MQDRTTKILLAFIAAGLWMNALVPVFHSQRASAQDSTTHLLLEQMQSDVSSIQSDVSSLESNLGRIAHGTCTNDKIC
jgi:hypothetical protein